MKTLNRLFDSLGLVPSVALGVLAFLMCLSVVSQVIPAALSQYPILAFSSVIIVMVVAGIGGLVWFWFVAELAKFRSRGYRVRWVNENEWIYEERKIEGEERCLTFLCKNLATGYMPPRAVSLPSESAWESQVPQWAQGRRTQIMEQIAKCLGADQGVAIQFLDQ